MRERNMDISFIYSFSMILSISSFVKLFFLFYITTSVKRRMVTIFQYFIGQR